MSRGGRRPQHAVSNLACRVLSSARACRSSICPGHLSTGWLVSLVILSPSGDTRGPSFVFEAAAQDHLICLTFLIISMTFILSLTQILVFLSLCVLLSILLSILVCAAASLFCACLVSLQVSAPYVIAGSTHELYTCLFRQTAMLLLKISRCLAYAAQPAMILCCIFVIIYPSSNSFLRSFPNHLNKSCLSCFLPKPSQLRCPSDIIPNLVHSCHS